MSLSLLSMSLLLLSLLLWVNNKFNRCIISYFLAEVSSCMCVCMRESEWRQRQHKKFIKSNKLIPFDPIKNHFRIKDICISLINFNLNINQKNHLEPKGQWTKNRPTDRPTTTNKELNFETTEQASSQRGRRVDEAFTN